MKMDAGLDTGDMLYKQQVEIGPEDDRISLTDKICDAGKLALLHTLSHFPELSSQAQRQNDSLSTYADKLENQSPCCGGRSLPKSSIASFGQDSAGAGLQFH